MDNKRSRDEEGHESPLTVYAATIEVLGELENEFADHTKRSYPLQCRYDTYFRSVEMLAFMLRCEDWIQMTKPSVFTKNHVLDDEDDQDTDEDDEDRIQDKYRSSIRYLCEAFDYFEEKHWLQTKRDQAASDHINGLYMYFYSFMTTIARETYCLDTVRENLWRPVEYRKKHQPRGQSTESIDQVHKK